jgi:hypothetical protein
VCGKNKPRLSAEKTGFYFLDAVHSKFCSLIPVRMVKMTGSINYLNLKPFIMKKSFLLLPIILALISLTSFGRIAPDTDPRAEDTFKKYFAGAANVNWSEEAGFLKVTFTWGEHRTVAYFNTNGELAGSIRNLFYNQLPLAVMRSVQQSFNNPVVVEIREVSNEEGIYYGLTVEDGNKRFKLRVNSAGDILEKTKIKK